MYPRSKTTLNRSGFTLIELLVVVGIITFLVGLSVAVMFGITDQANEEATNTTIQKINRLVQQRTEAFDRAFPSVLPTWRSNYINYLSREIANRAPGASPFAGNPARTQAILTRQTSGNIVWDILAKKAAYRFEFPQRAFDLLAGGNDANGNGVPDSLENRWANPIAKQQLIDAGNTNPTAAEITTQVEANWTIHVQHEVAAAADEATHSTESSEFLYYFLFHSGSYGASSTGESEFQQSEIADTDGDGFLEFVDSWGRPLRFYRWPTRLIDPTLNPTAFTLSNPADITNQDDDTDLAMVISVDGTPTILGEFNGRVVGQDERSVAEFLIKGLPRRLDFSPAYITAIASSFPDNPGIADVNVIIPPDPLLRDPDDPAGLLYSILENGLMIGTFSVDLTWEFNELNYHTPDTFHAPLIVSAGSDGQLGLYEPSDTANLGNLAMYNLDLDQDGTLGGPSDFELMTDFISDNLTNRNRRAGGR
ncbi:prepilin-type N-terminal cleavage/methylation domain-containing protein [Fuerstiella marisgermanici]|uniref:Type II secretion system protein G n=1 Tax=Fuerstiella marisgermanici TaxID=1891926 RepID=A0A1P8WFL3_9PLAN|nr:type II secretion system protein [Fuerstiella marisgermanici]APZ92827.1 type II secretion system protein G [Fuerstiella marisgermanici]